MPDFSSFRNPLLSPAAYKKAPDATTPAAKAAAKSQAPIYTRKLEVAKIMLAGIRIDSIPSQLANREGAAEHSKELTATANKEELYCYRNNWSDQAPPRNHHKVKTHTLVEELAKWGLVPVKAFFEEEPQELERDGAQGNPKRWCRVQIWFSDEVEKAITLNKDVMTYLGDVYENVWIYNNWKSREKDDRPGPGKFYREMTINLQMGHPMGKKAKGVSVLRVAPKTTDPAELGNTFTTEPYEQPADSVPTQS